MSNSMRALCAVIFFVVMAGVSKFVHFLADYGGAFAILAFLAVVFWAGVKMENKDRREDDREPYSAYEAGRDFREVAKTFPILIGLVLLAAAIRYLT